MKKSEVATTQPGEAVHDDRTGQDRDDGRAQAKARARRYAGRHAGYITYAQLRRFLTVSEIRTWLEQGLLIRTRRSVYALGYVRTDLIARLWEGVLYAGPGAYLDGSSAAHHLGLLSYPPAAVIVATPRQRESFPDLRVHCRRGVERVISPGGLPVAPTPELMLSLAAEGNYHAVRHALAVLEYRRKLDVSALLDVCRAGRRGGALLRKALNHRLPQLAYCKSELEVDFLLFCEAHHLPLPKVNVMIHGIEADMYWPQLGLIVELDGTGNHGTARQKRRDLETAGRLVSHGLTVIRFSHEDIHFDQAGTLMTLAEGGLRPAARPVV